MRIEANQTTVTQPSVESTKQTKLADAAQQFEASLMQELLKPMRSGEDSWGGDKDSDDGGSDTISSFGTEAMAKAISRGGGFGIAKQVIAQVNREHDRFTKKKS